MRQLTLIDQPLSSSAKAVTIATAELTQKKTAKKVKTIVVKPAINHGSITEVIISNDSAIQPVHLLPLLNQISIDERWLMWVSDVQHASPSLDRRWVQALGVKQERVVHLTCRNDNMLAISCKALAAKTGHLIIEWQGDLNTQDFDLLQKAANKGHSHALIIRRR